MIKKDLHIHTNFCDGLDKPEEYIRAAIEKKLDTVGFSVHSYTFFDESYCIGRDRIVEYISEINVLKKKYRDKISVFCGTEYDYYSNMPCENFDYLIGSVHYVETPDGKYFSVDEGKDALCALADKYFDGDFYALCEKYYRTVANVIDRTNADIIGHFDLITKYNEGGCLFDEKNERYVAAYTEAAKKLSGYGVPFEINTGAIGRGYRTAAYPSEDILKLLSTLGASVILSSDAHAAKNVALEFDKYEKLAKELGLRIV